MTVEIKTIKYVDYFELSDVVEKILSERENRKVNVRDYGGKWDFHEKMTKRVDAIYGDSWYHTSSDLHTPEQKEALEMFNGLVKDVPQYLDFWHFWVDKIDSDVNNGCISTIYPNDQLGYLEEDDDEPEWAKNIFKVFVECLPEEMRDECNIKYSW